MSTRTILPSLTLACLILGAHAPASRADELSVADFQKLHSMLKPQPGESRWMEIDWYPNIWEARQRAAAEGKPIFIPEPLRDPRYVPVEVWRAALGGEPAGNPVYDDDSVPVPGAVWRELLGRARPQTPTSMEQSRRQTNDFARRQVARLV